MDAPNKNLLVGGHSFFSAALIIRVARRTAFSALSLDLLTGSNGQTFVKRDMNNERRCPMSELSREQVEEQCRNVVYASNGDEGTHAAMNQMQYTDAALRARLHTQTERAEQAEAIIEQKERDQDGSNQRILELEQQVADLTAKLEAVQKDCRSVGYESVATLIESFCELTRTRTDLADKLEASEEALKQEECRNIDIVKLQQQLAASEQRVRELECELNDKDTVPRSRYNACNKDWLDGQVEHKILLEKTKVYIENDTKTIARLSKERDQLQATVTAQAKEIGQLQYLRGNMQELNEILSNMPQQGRADEDIPDDKEAAYRTGYSDAIIDCKQALASEKEA